MSRNVVLFAFLNILVTALYALYMYSIHRSIFPTFVALSHSRIFVVLTTMNTISVQVSVFTLVRWLLFGEVTAREWNVAVDQLMYFFFQILFAISYLRITLNTHSLALLALTSGMKVYHMLAIARMESVEAHVTLMQEIDAREEHPSQQSPTAPPPAVVADKEDPPSALAAPGQHTPCVVQEDPEPDTNQEPKSGEQSLPKQHENSVTQWMTAPIMRLCAALIFLLYTDLSMVMVSIGPIQTELLSIWTLMFLNWGNMLVLAVVSMLRLVVYLVELRGQMQRSTISIKFYLRVVSTLIQCCFELFFFGILWHAFGPPLYLIRDIYVTCRTVIKSVSLFTQYKQQCHIIDECEIPVEAAIEKDPMCVICMESMSGQGREGNEGTRQLPCGHILHLMCLYRYVERDTACPSCRRNILETLRKVSQPVARGGADAAGGTPADAERLLNNELYLKELYRAYTRSAMELAARGEGGAEEVRNKKEKACTTSETEAEEVPSAREVDRPSPPLPVAPHVDEAVEVEPCAVLTMLSSCMKCSNADVMTQCLKASVAEHNFTCTQIQRARWHLETVVSALRELEATRTEAEKKL